MRVGVPTEVNPDEYRVANDARRGSRARRRRPRGVRAERRRAGSAITDEDYSRREGARIVPAGMRPRCSTRLLADRQGQGAAAGRRSAGSSPVTRRSTTCTSPPTRKLTQGLTASGATCHRLRDDREPATAPPLLARCPRSPARSPPRSASVHAPEGARRRAGSSSAECPDSSSADVMVLGGGVVGTNAASIALGMGATVSVLDSATTISYPESRHLRRRSRWARELCSHAVDRRGTSPPPTSSAAPCWSTGPARRKVFTRDAQLGLPMRSARRSSSTSRSTRAAASRPRARPLTPTRPTRSTASRTTAWPTCRGPCRSPPPTR